MEKESKLIIIAAIIFIIFGILIFAPIWSYNTQNLISQFAGIVVTGTGFVIAWYQLRLSYKAIKAKEKDYLDLKLEIIKNDSFVSIKTQIINNTSEKLKIDNSFLLITKQEEDIIDCVNAIFSTQKVGTVVDCSNDFNKLKVFADSIFINQTIEFIPLHFYYLENVQIGNESPCYTYTFNNGLKNLEAGIYTVRFFIFCEGRYHRSTADSLIII